jgi:hypothetical protein
MHVNDVLGIKFRTLPPTSTVRAFHPTAGGGGSSGGRMDGSWTS